MSKVMFYRVVRCKACGNKYIVPSRYETKSCPQCGEKKNDFKTTTVSVHGNFADARAALARGGKARFTPAIDL